MGAIKFAFIRSIPVLCGYVFLGIAFGLLLQKAGYSILWAFLISAFVYAGSMQFILIGLLGTPISIFALIILTLSINCRHIFYGLSLLQSFKSMGKFYPYMIFSLTDETYSLLCSIKIPPTLNQNKVFFYIAGFNHMYWIFGSIIGSLIGEFIPFNTSGIDFAMTALFIVIFVEYWLDAKTNTPAIIGVICGVLSLAIFKANDFILPALVASIGVLLFFKQKIEPQLISKPNL